MTMLIGCEGGWEKAVIKEKNNKNKQSNFLLSMVMILDMADEINEKWRMKNEKWKMEQPGANTILNLFNPLNPFNN